MITIQGTASEDSGVYKTYLELEVLIQEFLNRRSKIIRFTSKTSKQLKRRLKR